MLVVDVGIGMVTLTITVLINDMFCCVFFCFSSLFPFLSFFLFFLSFLVWKTKVNHWTKRMVNTRLTT